MPHIGLVPPTLFATLRGMSRMFDRCCQLLLLLPCAVHAGPDGPPAKPSSTNLPGVVEIQGRVAPGPGGSPNPLYFKTVAGPSYTLVSNQMSTALFVDTNLQSKLLLLKGRIENSTRRFEVTGNLRSIRNGKVHELYYFCDICVIKTSDPGPCMCCREPVYLVEEPK